MSLLNDALRRASESDRNRPRPAQPQTSLRSVAEPRGQALALAMIVGSVLALALAGWFFWLLWGANHRIAPVVLEEPARILTPNAAPTTIVHAEIPPTQNLAVPLPQVSLPANAPAKPVVEDWPLDLKLTGIFFRVTNPQALISGRTVGVGDDIDGIQITKIEKDRVTVEWNGKVKELKVKEGGF